MKVVATYLEAEVSCVVVLHAQKPWGKSPLQLPSSKSSAPIAMVIRQVLFRRTNKSSINTTLNVLHHTVWNLKAPPSNQSKGMKNSAAARLSTKQHPQPSESPPSHQQPWGSHQQIFQQIRLTIFQPILVGQPENCLNKNQRIFSWSTWDMESEGSNQNQQNMCQIDFSERKFGKKHVVLCLQWDSWKTRLKAFAPWNSTIHHDCYIP